MVIGKNKSMTSVNNRGSRPQSGGGAVTGATLTTVLAVGRALALLLLDAAAPIVAGVCHCGYRGA